MFPQNPAVDNRPSQEYQGQRGVQNTGLPSTMVIDVSHVVGSYPIRYQRRPGSYGVMQMFIVFFFAFIAFDSLFSGSPFLAFFWALMTILQFTSYYKLAPKEYRVYADKITIVPWYQPLKEIVIPFHDIELVMYNSGICHMGIFYASNTSSMVELHMSRNTAACGCGNAIFLSPIDTQNFILDVNNARLGLPPMSNLSNNLPPAVLIAPGGSMAYSSAPPPPGVVSYMSNPYAQPTPYYDNYNAAPPAYPSVYPPETAQNTTRPNGQLRPM
jgi:hypothetical protein